MNRKEFLKGMGLAGIGLSLAPQISKADSSIEPSTQANCVLIPTETAGPFPWDLTANNAFFRQNVVEDREGIPLTVKMKILGDTNCSPMQNVRVHIWHCDKDGSYSAYDNSMNPGQAGKNILSWLADYRCKWRSPIHDNFSGMVQWSYMSYSLSGVCEFCLCRNISTYISFS
jgi:hypothetical protein